MGLHEKMNKLEKVRSRVSLGAILIGCGVIVFAIGMIATTINDNPGSGGFMILVFLLIGVGCFLIKGTGEKYKALYKEIFVEEPLMQNFENVFYSWRTGFSENEVRDFKIIAPWNKFKSEDYLKARYKNIDFQMADFDIQRSSGKSSYTIFHGRILVFDFPSKFVLSTHIYTKEMAYQNKPLKGIGDRIEMESEEFNKLFSVYSDIPHDSFYVLTPHYMEQLMKLQKIYPSFVISFEGNRVIVAVNERHNDAFDKLNRSEPVSYPDEIQKVQRDIDDIKKVIDIIDSFDSEKER